MGRVNGQRVCCAIAWICLRVAGNCSSTIVRQQAMDGDRLADRQGGSPSLGSRQHDVRAGREAEAPDARSTSAAPFCGTMLR